MCRDEEQRRIFPLLRAFLECEAGQNRRNHHGEDQRAKQGEGHCPRHRFEETAFHRLQREDGQVGSNNDGNGEEDRTLNFMRSGANLVLHRVGSIVGAMQMANDIFHHHNRAIDHHAEVERAQ